MQFKLILYPNKSLNVLVTAKPGSGTLNRYRKDSFYWYQRCI